MNKHSHYCCNPRYSLAALRPLQTTSFLWLLDTETEVMSTDSNKELQAIKSCSLNYPQLNFHSLMLIVQKHDTGLVIKSNHPWQGRTVYFWGVLSSQITSLFVFIPPNSRREWIKDLSSAGKEKREKKKILLIFSLVYWNWWWPIAPNKNLNSRFSSYSSSARSDATLYYSVLQGDLQHSV